MTEGNRADAGKPESGLHDRGTDSLGNHLIYDADQDLTWYDFANHDTWSNQLEWARSLSVEFDGRTYDDWRLPRAVDDGPYLLDYDGKSTAGFNITNSEMGHLFYKGLGNQGKIAPDGTQDPPGWGLVNTDPFHSLGLAEEAKRDYERQVIFSRYYWTSTEHSANPGTVWYHIFGPGYQDIMLSEAAMWAMPVRDGDVSSPEPGANLHDRGADSRGNHLIYDSELDVTWYDYSSPHDTWQNQMDWAGSLSVEFNGRTYDDWRLPTAVDGPYFLGCDGRTSAGFNITSSELGHLFYRGLGNKGIRSLGGFSPQEGWGLTYKGPFRNIEIDEGTPYGYYWTSTACADNPGAAWYHILGPGFEGIVFVGGKLWAMALRDGDVEGA